MQPIILHPNNHLIFFNIFFGIISLSQIKFHILAELHYFTTINKPGGFTYNPFLLRINALHFHLILPCTEEACFFYKGHYSSHRCLPNIRKNIDSLQLNNDESTSLNI